MEDSVMFVELVGAVNVTEGRGSPYTLYQLSVLRNDKLDIIARRYSQFKKLDSEVRRILSSIKSAKSELPKLTGRKLGRGMNVEVVEKRKRKLPLYLHDLVRLSAKYPQIGPALRLFMAHDALGTDGIGADSDHSHDDDLSRSRASSRSQITPPKDTSAAPPPPPGARPSRVSFGAASPPVMESDTSISGTCATCRRALHTGETTGTPDWDAEHYCSPQCEKFAQAAASKGFSIVQGGVVAKSGSGVPSPALKPVNNLAEKSSWWSSSRLNLFGSGREGSSNRKTSFSTSRKASSAAALETEDFDDDDTADTSAPATLTSPPVTPGSQGDATGFMRRARKSEKTSVLSNFRQSVMLKRSATTGPTLFNTSETIPSAASVPYRDLVDAVVGKGARGDDDESGGPVVVHCQGYLYKLSGIRKAWKRRYFELRDRSLYYFATPGSKLLGTIQLLKVPSHVELQAYIQAAKLRSEDVTAPGFLERLLTQPGFFYASVVEEMPSSPKLQSLPDKARSQGPFAFQVKTPLRELLVACESADSFNTWKTTINRIVNNEKQRLGAIIATLIPSQPSTATSAATHSETNAAAREPIKSSSSGGVGLPPVVALPVAGADEHKDNDLDEEHTEAAPTGTVDAGEQPPGSSNAWEISASDLEVVESIGSGSFGEVYRGRLWGTEVAVKLLAPGSVTDEILNSLKAEISILSELRHPNVVLYLGACTTLPDIFVVTEWCERGSLQSLLYDHTVPMSVSNRLGLALQAAQGMAYLQSPKRKIIHRDLKSHNLLVTRDFTVKVADFGLTIVRKGQIEPATIRTDTPMAVYDSSKSIDSSDKGDRKRLDHLMKIAKSTPADNSILRTKSEHLHSVAEEEGQFYGVHGTPQWMAPEVLEGQRYNSSVDMYSFGVVLCEIFSRILPFSDTYKRFDFIDAVLEEGAMPSLPKWCGALPDAPSAWEKDSELESVTNADGTAWGWTEDVNSVQCQEAEELYVAKDMPPLSGGRGSVRKLRRFHSPEPVVIGGVQEWSIAAGDCTGVLKLMVESCLSRDPSARPTFEELVDLLRAVTDRPPSELFLQLEVPRIRDTLAYGSDTAVAVVANEIVHFSAYALFCNLSALPGAGIARLHGFNEHEQANIGIFGSGNDTLLPTAAAARGLVVKFQVGSTAFGALLPFAAAPCMNMSHMFGVCYIDLQTVILAAPQLLAALCSRLRALDLYIRAKLHMPLVSDDLAVAVANREAATQFVVRRTADYGVRCQIGVSVEQYAWKDMLDEVQSAEAKNDAVETPGQAAKRMGAAARAAARAAAVKQAEEQALFRGRVSATTQVLHAATVLLQVIDAATPSLTFVQTDDGAEKYVALGDSVKLPPVGSVDRLLLVHSSRIVYALSTVLSATTFSAVEQSFLSRPPPDTMLDWRARVKSRFNPVNVADFGSDAVCSAAMFLRSLWNRLPILRSSIAHILAESALYVASTLDTIALDVVAADGKGYTIQVSEEVVMARYLGVFLARAAWSGEPANARSATQPTHPMVSAISSRVRGAVVKRMDDVILGSVEVEDFDLTLC